MADTIYNVPFICTGHAARSTVAEGLLNKPGNARLYTCPADSHPGDKVHPLALATLRRHVESFPALPLQRLDAISLLRELRDIGCQ